MIASSCYAFESYCTNGIRGDLLQHFGPGGVILESDVLKQYSVKSNVTSTKVECYRHSGEKRCEKRLHRDQTFRCAPGDLFQTPECCGTVYVLTEAIPACEASSNDIFLNVKKGTTTNCKQVLSVGRGTKLQLTSTEIDIPASGRDANAYYQCDSGDKRILKKGVQVACEENSMTVVLDGAQWHLNDTGSLEADFNYLDLDESDTSDGAVLSSWIFIPAIMMLWV